METSDIFTGTYEATYIDYTVKFVDYNDSVISQNTYHYSDTVTVPNDPTRDADNTYTYAFDGWNKTVTTVSGDTTYKATYEATYIDYTVKFINYDDSVISETTYHYGDTVTVPTNPTKPADNTYTYEFNEWDKAVTNVTGDATYKATYEATYIDYTVKFIDYDNTVLSEKKYHYGDEVAVPDNPAREDDNKYMYTFKGWDKNVVNVTSDAMYKAVYDSKEKSSQFMPGDINGDGEVNNKDIVTLFRYVSNSGIELSNKPYIPGKSITVIGIIPKKSYVI